MAEPRADLKKPTRSRRNRITLLTRLTRRDLARRRGYRLDHAKTVHGNIRHGGVPIRFLCQSARKQAAALGVLLDPPAR